MIAMLTGVVAEKTSDIVILDVNGVGYGLLVTNEDYGRLGSADVVKFYIYEHIRENAHDLYGFTSIDSKQLFELLLTVTGIGPKMALNVLSVGTANEVRQAIATADVKYIQQANGVGKRVAERVVVELKDKVGLEGVDLAGTSLMQSSAGLRGDEAAEALVALGYSAQDAATILANVPKDLPTETRIRHALQRT